MDKTPLDIKKLRDSYYEIKPDLSDPAQKVSFGTSGHRGNPFLGTFNETHIAAIVQAVIDYRKKSSINGPLFLGMDSHAVSLPAIMTTIEVLAANGIDSLIEQRLNFDDRGGYTPTPAVSFAILEENKKSNDKKSDGIIITPSHNPPADGGIKYNPPTGGPADASITKWIEEKANGYLRDNNNGVRRAAFSKAMNSGHIKRHDFITPYVKALDSMIDMDAIKSSGINIGTDPMGGAALEYLAPIAEMYGLNMEVANPAIDVTFCFMPNDKDGKIRMDCSSSFAMANLIKLKDKYDIAWGNDTDSDRHGIVTKSSGLMNPNHYLSVAINYLYQKRTSWPKDCMVGKTLVSSSMIDRVAASLGRKIFETPVGFKYFVDALLSKKIAFGGEESAGASFLRKDGSIWSTDKDGIIMGLLAAEILATTGRDPGILYKDLTAAFGEPVYDRIDTPASPEVKNKLKNLSGDNIRTAILAGEKIETILTHASNGEAIGGIKVTTKNGWFAARPSGTENIAKLYAESFLGKEHLIKIIEEAKEIIAKTAA